MEHNMSMQERDRLLIQLNAAAKKLGLPPTPRVNVFFEKLNPLNLDILEKSEFPSHTYTRNFINRYICMMMDVPGDGGSTFDAGYMSVKDKSGNVRAIDTIVGRRGDRSAGAYGYCNNGANANYGVIVGSGDTAWAANQYVLATLIDHGTGSGQLSYQTMANPAATYVSGTKTWTHRISRVFINESGGDVTVAEVGVLYAGEGFYTSTGYYLEIRDVLASPVVIANGEAYRFGWDISVVHPFD